MASPEVDRQLARDPVWARWRRTLGVSVPLSVIAVAVGICYLWPLLGSVPPPTGGSVLNANLPPLSSGHPLGTGPTGYDVWSRLLYGGQASLEIALAVTVIGLCVGGLVGAFSAYLGGKVDAVIMRMLDLLLAFPALVLALVLAQGLGPSQLNTIWAISFLVVPTFARVSRGSALRLREEPFMMAAKLSGTKIGRTILRHIGPNVLPQLITFAMLQMAIVIVIGGSLSFLGAGIPPPQPSWGNMIYEGQKSLATTPWLVVFPCAALIMTVIAFNLLGEALRQRWDIQ